MDSRQKLMCKFVTKVHYMKIRLLHFLLLSFSINFAQTNLFVATTGNDNTGNGSISTPYKTIEKAADVANSNIISSPTIPVNILVRAGLYRNSGFTTNTILDENNYDPQNAGEAIWKTNNTTGTAVRLNNINGNATAWITIKPYNNELVTIEGDGDTIFSIRNCSYVKVEGLEIKGVLDKIPLLLAWKYWGTYRYLVSGNYVYGDRKTDICTQYGITPCTDIPPNVLITGTTYTGLSDISTLNVERPAIFGGKGLLVQLSHHVDVTNCEVHHCPGGGLRVTQSDYVNFKRNKVHHTTTRASVGTHGVVAEGLTPDSGDNSAVEKLKISENLVYSNYNEIYSWVQSKTLVTVGIDEGKGICLLRTSPTMSGFNGIIRVENNISYDNGKSGIHTNDVDNAEIINNTVYNNGHTNIYNAAISGGTNAGISLQSSNNIKIINNIVTVPDNLTPPLQALSEGQNCNGEIVSNNIIQGGGSSDFSGGYTIANPLFVDANNNNVSLQSTSPAIDTALSSVAPLIDYNGSSRITPDIGAIEYSASLELPSYIFREIKTYPNPTQNEATISNYIDELRIFNFLGQDVTNLVNIKKDNINSYINLENLNSGIYVLEIHGKSIKILKK